MIGWARSGRAGCRGAFTFVEILMVVLLVGIIVAAGFTGLRFPVGEARDRSLVGRVTAAVLACQQAAAVQGMTVRWHRQGPQLLAVAAIPGPGDLRPVPGVSPLRIDDLTEPTIADLARLRFMPGGSVATADGQPVPVLRLEPRSVDGRPLPPVLIALSPGSR